jgi:hypothetical protein
MSGLESGFYRPEIPLQIEKLPEGVWGRKREALKDADKPLFESNGERHSPEWEEKMDRLLASLEKDFGKVTQENSDMGENAHHFTRNGKEIQKDKNDNLKGKEHPVTGVPYIRDTVECPNGDIVEGVFPEFSPVFETKLDKNENGDYVGDRTKHEQNCNEKLKEAIEKDPELKKKFTPEQLEQIRNGETPDGYTWHHHQQPGKMQLVDSETHGKSAHTGGYAIWGKNTQET